MNKDNRNIYNGYILREAPYWEDYDIDDLRAEIQSRKNQDAAPEEIAKLEASLADKLQAQADAGAGAGDYNTTNYSSSTNIDPLTSTPASVSPDPPVATPPEETLQSLAAKQGNTGSVTPLGRNDLSGLDFSGGNGGRPPVNSKSLSPSAQATLDSIPSGADLMPQLSKPTRRTSVPDGAPTGDPVATGATSLGTPWGAQFDAKSAAASAAAPTSPAVPPTAVPPTAVPPTAVPPAVAPKGPGALMNQTAPSLTGMPKDVVASASSGANAPAPKVKKARSTPWSAKAQDARAEAEMSGKGADVVSDDDYAAQQAWKNRNQSWARNARNMYDRSGRFAGPGKQDSRGSQKYRDALTAKWKQNQHSGAERKEYIDKHGGSGFGYDMGQLKHAPRNIAAGFRGAGSAIAGRNSQPELTKTGNAKVDPDTGKTIFRKPDPKKPSLLGKVAQGIGNAFKPKSPRVQPSTPSAPVAKDGFGRPDVNRRKSRVVTNSSYSAFDDVLNQFGVSDLVNEKKK